MMKTSSVVSDSSRFAVPRATSGANAAISRNVTNPSLKNNCMMIPRYNSSAAK